MVRSPFARVPLLLVVASLAAACSTSGSSASPAIPTTAAPASEAPSVSVEAPSASAGADLSKPPYTVAFDWGTFTLNSTIATKVQAHDPFNFLIEGQADGFPVISKQTRDAIQRAVPDAQKIYPFKDSYFAPPGNAYNEPLQISQIQAQLDAGQIDCLIVAPTTATGLDKIMSTMVAQGIPVFTVGVPTDGQGHEFTNLVPDPTKEGIKAAQSTVDWMKANNINFKVFAVSSALPPEVWAQGRMKGFIDTIKQLVPGATFINDEKSALNTTLDPTATYDKAKAFLQGNPTVQLLMNTDIGDHLIDKAIEDLSLKNKVYTIGWNPGEANLGYVLSGTQIAVQDADINNVWGGAVNACPTFFATGQVAPNDLTDTSIQKDQAQAELDKLKAQSGG